MMGYTPHTLNLYFWKCMAVIIVFINIKGGHHSSTDAVPCLFFNNDTAVTTISPLGQSNVALLECAATCCCEKARCCSCDQSSGDTFIPCHINTATPVSPLPTITDSWTETDVPLYEECYNSSTTTTSTTTTTEDTTTTTSTTEETTDPTTTDPPTSTSSVPTSTGSSDVRRAPSRGGDSGGLSQGSVIAIVIVSVAVLVALVAIIIFFVKRKNGKKNQVEDEPDPEPITERSHPPKSTIIAGSALTKDWRQARKPEDKEPGEIKPQGPRQLPPLRSNLHVPQPL